MEQLKHIAFIPDGNRRWAVSHGLSALKGHESGFENVSRLLSSLIANKIQYVTIFAFSTENWNRSVEEVSHLIWLFKKWFGSYENYLNSNGVRIKVIGDLSRLPQDLQDEITTLTENTKNNDKITIICALSYSGRGEIVRAAKKIAQDVLDKKLAIDQIDEDLFSSSLDLADIPEPDILVRTSEQRISNFLLWHIAYSEILFIDKYWPDLDESDVKHIVDVFSKRKRRYGK